MKGFVVNIDLSTYFDDLRKYAIVFVDPSHCKTVGDVEKHIRTVFKLDDNICLTSSLYAEDFLIPRSEDVNILNQQPIEIIKVQKCDFYDHQIHKGNQVKIACDQTALNLIHSERSIDLSCRPKQRLKLNSNHTNCTHDPSLHILIASNDIKKSNQAVCNFSEVYSKEKQKHSKRKSDTENGAHVQNDILDMSFNKNTSKYYENCFTDRSIEVVNDLDITEKSDDMHECHKKVKKRKHGSNAKGDIELASSCWNIWAPEGENEQPSKKSKKKTHHEKTETITDLCIYNNSLSGHEANPPSKKKRKKETQTLYIHDNNCEDESKTSTNDDLLTQNKNKKKSKKKLESSEDPMNSVEEVEEKYLKVNCSSLLEETKKSRLKLETQEGCHETISLVDKHVKLPAQSIPFVNEQGSTSSYLSNEDDMTKEDELSKNYSNTKTKRKRVRKHNKKKKREKMQYSAGVGTLLNILNKSQEKPLLQPVAANHIFFSEDGSKEQSMNNCNESLTSDNNALQGDTLPNEKEVCSRNGLSECPEGDGITKKPTWVEEFMKLSTSKSKPIIFQRVPPSSLPSGENVEPASNSKPQNTKTNLCEDNVQNLRSNQDSQEHFINQNKNLCNGDLNIVKCSNSNTVSKESTTEMKSTLEDLQTVTIDTDNIIITNYPIIDKVVVNDLILFKILKMNDAEPGLSKTILAKVKGTTNFPDRISLLIMALDPCGDNIHILGSTRKSASVENFKAIYNKYRLFPCRLKGGCDECEHRLPESSDSSGTKKREFTLEFNWIEIFEPRLFYP